MTDFVLVYIYLTYIEFKVRKAISVNNNNLNQ